MRGFPGLSRWCLAATALLLSPLTADAQSVKWGGAYIGAHLGGGWGGLDDGAGTIKTNGMLGGAHAGYNFQNGNIVYGLEGDFSWANGEGSQSSSGGGCVIVQRVCVPFATTTDVKAQLDWLASVRGRLGVTLGNALVYGTGGIAWAHSELKVVSSGVGAGSWSSGGTHTGWVAGGGVEMKLMPNLSARIEALHYSLGDVDFHVAGTGVPLDLDVTTVRAGLTFHLN